MIQHARELDFLPGQEVALAFLPNVSQLNVMPQPAAVNQPLPIPRVFGRIHPFLALDEARAGAAELPSPARPLSYDDPCS